MNLIALTFNENPAAFSAEYVLNHKLDPLRTLIVSPTQRFKSFFASALLQLQGDRAALSPFLVTSANLIQAILSMTGKTLSADMGKFTMFLRACRMTDEFEEIFPKETLLSFLRFRSIAQKFFGVFRELGMEELMPGSGRWIEVFSTRGDLSKNEDSTFSIQVRLLGSIWNNYSGVQRKKGFYDETVLIGEIQNEGIAGYFESFDSVLLVSPLSLTQFEKRIFGAIEDKLTVIYQDTKSYDFSRIISFREELSNGRKEKKGRFHFLHAPSKMAQVMAVLALIEDELAAGVRPNEIAVINNDSDTAQMLYDSMRSAGIDTNFSEGMRIKKSPLYQFVKLVFRFFGSGFDAELFVQLLRNEIFAELTLTSREESLCIEREIQHARMFNLSSLDIPPVENDRRRKDLFKLLGELYHSTSIKILYGNLERLFALFGGKKTYEFYAVRDVLLDSVLELGDLSVKFQESPFEIFLQYVEPKRYPLPGIYRRGVQILGLLETRGIGFKKVVVPSFNEGYFPVRYESDILLSAEMRKRLGLPTQLEREELGLYYLMRIAHSADDTFFVSIKDTGGEIDVMSRYGYLFSPRAPIEAEVRYAYPSRLDAEGSVRLPPTQPSMTHPIREFSRMDIERIKRCETQYYIAKVLRIHDVDKLRKDIEPHIVGQKVHTLFSALYRDVDFSALNDGFLERRLKVLFDEHFSEGFFFTREEDLLKRILIGNLQRAVDRDLDRFRGGYRVCSEFIEKEFTAALGQYTLRGIIDRIDRTPDGSYSIIDYKTGSIPPRKDHLEEAGFKQVQLGFYGLLFQKNFPDARIEGLSYFDVNRRNDLEKIINSDEMTVYLADFESWLAAFLDVFNTKDVLSLTNDTENCRYCPYPNICRIYEL